MTPIEGRIALVTGGARGIGRAIARALVEQGARVVIADVDELELHRTADAIGAWPVRLDVREPDGWAAALERVERERGPIDILVNNAGIMSVGPFLAIDAAAHRRQVDVNLWGVIHGMRAVLPGMVERGRGHVVNIASAAGRIPTPHAAVYSATKHAVVGLSESVRHEVKPHGVGITCVLPSFVDTELIAGATKPVWPPVVSPDDVAEAAVSAILRDRVEVYVPRVAVLATILPALLPRFLLERLGRALGVDQLFAHVDPVARDAYERRARG